MKSYVSSDSSSDDEALIVLKNKNTQKEGNQDPNEYTSLLELNWQQCEFCDEVFANRYTLVRHNTSHIIIPLIKQTTHECKECYHHFTSIQDLNSHTSKCHTQKPTSIPNNEKILQSIIKNQVIVKCQDDLKDVLIKHNEYKNKNENFTKTGKTVVSNTKIGFGEGIRQNKSFTNNAWTSRNNVKHVHNKRIKVEDVKSNTWTLENGHVKNVIKEELTSPIKFERSSSPTDEDTESIRHRLLFEEDVEDTLLKDLSVDCQVNIETLCKEVTLDFDDAVLEDDKTVILNSNDGTDNFENGSTSIINVTSTQATNSFDNVTNGFEKRINNFGIVANEFGNRINNFENRTNTAITETKNLANGINDFAYFTLNNGIDSFFINGTENIKNLKSIENEVIDLEFYEESIHFDTLMVPEDSICKFCKQEFANRLLLIQHEKEHMTVKKTIQNRALLCCYCERYIVGNYHKLRSHKEKVHPDKDLEKQFNTQNCPKCKLKYFNYVKHLKYHHEHYNCNVCERGFETVTKKREHECKPNLNELGRPNLTFGKTQFNERKSAIMKLCELCYSFMKIYIQNRQNYEVVGMKTEFGVRQTCDKCNNLCFTVKLVKRKSFVRVEENKKVLEVKSKVKPLSNKERLVKIQNRLKLLKKINK